MSNKRDTKPWYHCAMQKEANAFMRPTHDYCSPTLPRKERTFWFCFEPFLATCSPKISRLFAIEGGPNCSKWSLNRLISLVHPKWPNIGCAKTRMLPMFGQLYGP